MAEASTVGKAFSIDSFRSKGLVGGGARPALFEVNWTDSSANVPLAKPLLVKAASIPASNIAPLAVNYGGRAYKLQGFRTFDPWPVTIIQDEDFTNRNNLIFWMKKISGNLDGSRSKTTAASGGQPATTGTTWDYDGTATVSQLDKQGSVVQVYKFYNLWPTEIAEIPLAWDSDMIEEYSVTFAYDYWTHGITAADNVSVVGAGSPTAG
jgi:hypothetical protein